MPGRVSLLIPGRNTGGTEGHRAAESSKRISAAAVTATAEPDAPRTRAAIKAAKANANSAKGKSGGAKRAK
ncbi:hypothetical protein RSAG8_09448, partial [Rhizoctonia solani AG-8 WAC10335]